MNSFVGGAVLFVFTQLISFRFSTQWILTTDPWLRGNLLDAVYKFRRIITDSIGTNPLLYTEIEKNSTVSVNALDRTKNIHRGYYMAARRHEISLLVLKIFHEWAQRTSNIAETWFVVFPARTKARFSVTMVTLIFHAWRYQVFGVKLTR